MYKVPGRYEITVNKKVIEVIIDSFEDYFEITKMMMLEEKVNCHSAKRIGDK